jgi:hypothetical protein
MTTSLEIFDNPLLAQTRIAELRNFGVANPRLLQAGRLAAYDRRGNPPDPADWIRSAADNQELLIVQYER